MCLGKREMDGNGTGCLRVLLVCDTPGHAEQRLHQGLVDAGFQVDTLGSAAELYRQLFRETYDLILIDSVLPDENGYSVAARLRCVRRVGVEMLATLSELFASVPGEGGGRDYDVERVARHLRAVASMADVPVEPSSVAWRHPDTTAQVLRRAS